MDFFNGKLTKGNIKGLVVRLKMLQRNMEVKGKVMQATVNEPTLLVFLAKRVHKLVMKLQAHWRVRRPKEKKKGANDKNSTRKLPLPKMVELLKKEYLEKELNCVLNESGRNMLIKGHNKKFFQR